MKTAGKPSIVIFCFCFVVVVLLLLSSHRCCCCCLVTEPTPPPTHTHPHTHTQMMVWCTCGGTTALRLERAQRWSQHGGPSQTCSLPQEVSCGIYHVSGTDACHYVLGLRPDQINSLLHDSLCPILVNITEGGVHTISVADSQGVHAKPLWSLCFVGF